LATQLPGVVIFWPHHHFLWMFLGDWKWKKTFFPFILTTKDFVKLKFGNKSLEIKHYFIPKFNKISSFYGYIERRVWGWKEAQRQGGFMYVHLHLHAPKHSHGRVSEFDKYLHWIRVNVNSLDVLV
jgi:hypothetical protein